MFSVDVQIRLVSLSTSNVSGLQGHSQKKKIVSGWDFGVRGRLLNKPALYLYPVSGRVPGPLIAPGAHLSATNHLVHQRTPGPSARLQRFLLGGAAEVK